MKAMVDAAAANSSTDGAMLANQASFGVWAAVNQVPFATANAQLSSITSVESTLTAAQTAVSGSVGGTTGQSFALTTGTDAPSSTVGNDTYTAGDVAGVAAWTVGDAINGGNGTDTFTVISSAAITKPTAATVTNVETMNATSGATVTLNTTSFTGLTALNTTSVDGAAVTAAATTAVSVTDAMTTGGGVDTIAVDGGSTVAVTVTNNILDTITVGATTAAAGAVTVTSTGGTANGNTGGAIAVTGGTTITVNQNAGNSAATGTDTTGGAITATGNASTTAITVNQTTTATGFTATTTAAGVVGYTAGAVTIADRNAGTSSTNTIATVTLNNAGAATVDSNALSTLNLSGTLVTVDTTNTSTATTPAVTTVALNLTGATSTGAVTIDAEVTTLNVASNTTASTLNSLVANGATTVNVSGDKALTLTGNTLGAVTAINVTNTAGASFGTALGTGVTFTGGTGADSISIGSTTKAITMGAGNDTVTTSSAAVGTGGSVAAGEGTDTIIMTDALAAGADGSSTFNTKFTGFEVLRISDAFVENALDIDGLNDVTKVILAAGVSGTAAMVNLNSGSTVQILADGAATPDLTIGVDGAVTSASDTLTIALTGADIAAGSVTVANVERINLDTSDPTTAISADNGSITLVATAATSLYVSGNNGLAITNTGNTLIATFDASGIVANNTVATATVAATTDAAAQLGVSFTSDNITTVVTITGGAGNDTLAADSASTFANTLTGGEGADTLTGGAGNDIFVLTETTAAIDNVVLVTAASNGVDTIRGFAAGTGIDTVTLAATTTQGTTSGAAVFATPTNTTLTVGAAAFALTGASSTTSDVIELTATLSSYGNLGLAGATSGTELLKALSSTDAAATSITATTADDDFYMVAYQNGNAYLYQVTNGADTTVIASEIALIGVFEGITAGAFASGDFLMA